MKKKMRAIELLIVMIMVSTTFLSKSNVYAAKYEIITYGDSISAYVNEENFLRFEIYSNKENVTYNDKEYKKVRVKSSNQKICKISKDMRSVIGIKEGTCKITIEYGKARKVMSVKVEQPRITTTAVPAGCNTSIMCTGNSYGGDKAKYKLDKKKVAKLVEDNQYIEGLKPGTVKLTITNAKGHSLTKKITVLPKLELKLEDYKTVKKKGKVVGYKLKIKNDSPRSVVFTGGMIGDMYGLSYLDVSKNVTIKAGERKIITYYDKYASERCDKEGNLFNDYVFGGKIKYCNYRFSFWFDDDGKSRKSVYEDN